MRQAFIKKGSVSSYQVTQPLIKKGYIKIAVSYSTVSAGTEITTLKSSEKSILRRALDEPDKILKVFDILKYQGFQTAKNKIFSSIEKLNSFGYSISGKIIEIGDDVSDFAIGDLVCAGGSGFAMHAGIVVVPKNLVVKVPQGISLQDASTTTVGAIALHGIRRADLRLGENVVVIGVGLLGLLALQMLRASGVKVACIDINKNRLEIAKELGADLIVNSLEEDPTQAIQNWTNGYGTDAVLFMANTERYEPLSQAFRMCRKKGRVVLVGVSGMNIDRNDIYRNEIDFLVSSSYGPGRYDDNYELKGQDYPYSYVRWTENRNMQAYLEMLKDDKVLINKIIPKFYGINEVELAYKNIEEKPEDHILTILSYDNESQEDIETIITSNSLLVDKSKINIGLIGSGSFATGTLLPIINKHSDKFYIKSIFNNSGDKALNTANLFSANEVVSSENQIFEDKDIDLVMICTRHNSHTNFVLQALKMGKHVYVEKPLSISLDELAKIENFYKGDDKNKPILFVGFNRRFSKYALEIKKLLSNRTSPLFMRYRMNAGFIPYDSWAHEDGGRIIGEACHIIDLMNYFTNSKVKDYSVNSINPNNGRFKSVDNRSISLSYEDGSIGNIDYFSCGNSDMPKEYMELHYDNKSLIINDFKELISYGVKANSFKSNLSQKGHEDEWVAIYKALRSGNWTISLEDLVHTTKVTIITAS